MTIQAALKEGCSLLTNAEVETPILDSTILLAHALKMTKENLFASLLNSVDENAFAAFKEFVRKRCEGIPVSYIRRTKEFYGLEFYVDERVLVPRPDTETLVETLITILDENPGFRSVHDLCTGSGCIAISLKYTRPGLEVTASDISPDAGEVFRLNCRRILGKELAFYCSDLMRDLDGCFDIIAANPPYVYDNEVDDMMKRGWPEPGLALYGGKDGCEVTRRLIREAPSFLCPGGYLVLESSPPAMDELLKTMEKSGFVDISIIKDLGARDRVIMGKLLWDK
ncbi:MAG: peptide chain release factor N(5)-glutamine methyltransferase [Spirochaetales bacterium]|nr:peptide chain release factor N(5)-glutamine methyltransferase [Spirochaetales bacterium]